MLMLTAEQFIDKWWNVSSPLTPDIEDWIENTYRFPTSFWNEVVLPRQEKLLPPCRSTFAESYNFYYDCVTRHLGSKAIAFSHIKEHAYPDQWSYERVHQCVNFHIDKWSSFSPKPRQIIAIVGPPNIHFLISLLTSLRFGLLIYYLPTNSPYIGKSKINRLLSEITPDFIVSGEVAAAFEGAHPLSINLNGLDEENHSPESYTYSADSPINIALCPQEQEELAFSPIDAQTFYLHALRDGLLTLNLPDHRCWSMPLACPIRSEPFCTIASLLCGATRVYVSDDSIRNHPELLQDEKIHLIGISRTLLQLWTKAPGVPSRYLKTCFKSPFDLRYQEWKTLAQINQIEKIPTVDCVLDNSWGGITLFSRPSLDHYAVSYRPGLGAGWRLNQVDGTQEPAANEYGIFHSSISSNEQRGASGNLIATKIDHQLMLTGCLNPSREGITFPIDEIEGCVNPLPYVNLSMVHPIMKMGYPFSSTFILLVFVNEIKPDLSNEIPLWTREIENTISLNIGSGFLPDRIEFLPLVPKSNSLGIDRGWCANQYNSGSLLRKKSLHPYHLIGKLKQLVQKEQSSSR